MTLISVAISQTPAYTAGPWVRGYRIVQYSRDLHGDGDGGNPAECTGMDIIAAGIPRGRN